MPTNALAFGLSVVWVSMGMSGAPTDARVESVGMLAGDNPEPDKGFFGSMLIVRRVQYN